MTLSPFRDIVADMETDAPKRKTATATAVDLILQARGHGDVVGLVATMRAERQSYRVIADRITELTGVELTYEGVRGWALSWGVDAKAAA